MDSFFDYIVIIFFIISLISSLFKDRKKKPPVDSSPDGNNQYDFPDFNDDYTEEEESHAPVVTSFENQTPLSDKKNEEFIPPTMENKYKEILERRKAEYDSIKSSNSDEKPYETEYLENRITNILDIVREPENLRDAFIVSELLNKPVGLRDLDE